MEYPDFFLFNLEKGCKPLSRHFLDFVETFLRTLVLNLIMETDISNFEVRQLKQGFGVFFGKKRFAVCSSFEEADEMKFYFQNKMHGRM